MVKEAVVLRVHLPLVRVGLAADRLGTVHPAPAGQEADARARRCFVVDDEIGVAGELAGAVRLGERREAQPTRQLDQHLLERLALPMWLDDRDAHGVHRPVELRDRAIQDRHHVVPLQVGGVGQHQIGERGHFRLECIAYHQERDLVFAVCTLVVQHLAHLHGVHAGVPGHVRHEDQQGVDPVWVTAPGVGDHVVHQPVHRQRVFPRERLVDANRFPVVVDAQVVRVGGKAQRHAFERAVRFDVLRAARRFGDGGNGTRKRRLVPKTPRPVDRAEQAHQDGQGAHGLKTVGVRRQTAHRMESDRVAGHRLVLDTP